MQIRTLSVVIPVYNERATFGELLRRVEAARIPLGKEIVLVDDGSTDGSRDLVRAREGRPGTVVRLHARNRGKGAALRTGFEAATGDLL
ncbi:MAG: glycosyltransferase family 2 protein, partial [Planctomycetes bacterium]|nr:glycosyltransferase family 2 protein [Planctomycetota bacterium]